MSSLNNSIGGYFELELAAAKSCLYEDAYWYQSARAAFTALLLQLPLVECVHVPVYICDSMLVPIRSANKKIIYYSINEKFSASNLNNINSNELFLYVNYFGVCDNNVKIILNQINPKQVIIDCAQAFYSGPYECLATIYSPRKFFGVPDGGVLVTKQLLVLPIDEDQESASRMMHLIDRIAFSAEIGYASYKKAEESLRDLTPKRASKLTRRLLKSIDYLGIAKKRNQNFLTMHEALSESNQLDIDCKTYAPMCYPYMPPKPLNKVLLAEQKIFIPTYWSEVTTRTSPSDFAFKAASSLLALPCDQRYDPQSLQRLLRVIKK